MTKNELLNTIRAQTDRLFLCDIIKVSLETLPSAYVETLVYDLNTKYLFEGQVYTVTNKKNPADVHIFAGAMDVHSFFRSLNPRYSNDQLFRARNVDGRTIYGYTVEYKDIKRKETA